MGRDKKIGAILTGQALSVIY